MRTNDGDLHQYHGSLSIGSLTDKLHLEGPIRKGKTSFSLSGRFMPTTLIPNAVNTSESYGTHISTDKYNYYFYDLNAKLNHKFNDRSRLFLGFTAAKTITTITTTTSRLTIHPLRSNITPVKPA